MQRQREKDQFQNSPSANTGFWKKDKEPKALSNPSSSSSTNNNNKPPPPVKETKPVKNDPPPPKEKEKEREREKPIPTSAPMKTVPLQRTVTDEEVVPNDKNISSPTLVKAPAEKEKKTKRIPSQRRRIYQNWSRSKRS